jgi:putative transcriptional regulator
MESLRGQLLIANGSLFDPNFRQAVVLVAEHADEGAVGVVLNRPARITVAEAAPAFVGLTAPTEPIYIGGPVEPDAAIVLAQAADPVDLTSVVFGSIGLLGDSPDGIPTSNITRTRVFAGYAGWGPGQLENELEESSWITEDAQPSDVFTETPEVLWGQILRRKGGPFAMLATMPFDPSHN